MRSSSGGLEHALHKSTCFLISAFGELKIELQGNLASMLKAAPAQNSGASLPSLGRWGAECGGDQIADLLKVPRAGGA